MKTTLLSACVCALAFTGCKKGPAPTPPPAPQSAPAPVAVAPAPVADTFDAGLDLDGDVIAPEDIVALPHEHKGSVDHLARAEQLRSEGDLEGALTEARRAVYDSPDDEVALDRAARLAKETHQKDIAIEAFERLGQIRSEDPQPLLQEARLLLSKHDDDGAIEVAREALIRDEDSAEGEQIIGLAQLEKGELELAIGAFQKAVDIDPTHGHALNNLGLAYLRANRNDDAVDVLTRAAELLPQVAYVQNNLGVALERIGKLEEAKLAYGRATSLSPKYVKAQLNARRVKKMASAKDRVTDPEDGQPDDASTLPPDVE